MEKNDYIKKRLDVIDAARALAVYTVIVGHIVSNTSPVFRFIFAFHMPAFFFFAGYCFSDPSCEPFGSYVFRKTKRILIPYVVLCLIGLLIMQIFPAEWRPEQPVKWYLLRYFYDTQPPALGQIWFLVCLFIASVIQFIILRLQTKESIPWLIIVTLLFAAAGTWFVPRIFVLDLGRLPFKTDSAVTAVSFMLSAYIIRRSEIFFKIPDHIKAMALVFLPFIVWLFGVKLNGYVNICECAYGNPFYYFIAAFAGVFWLLDAARLLKNIKWLCWLGKNSLPIFGIHSFVLWCFVKLYCFTVGEEMKKLPDNIWAFLIPVAVYACCIPFALVWNKVKEYVLKNIKA